MPTNNLTSIVKSIRDQEGFIAASEALAAAYRIEDLEKALKDLSLQASIIHTMGHDATNMQFISLGNKIHLAKEVLK